MDRKVNIIDFETGRSVSITVDEEDMIDTLLNKVKNYWAKQGDYVLASSGEILAPVCMLKDYNIDDEDILQFRARSSLEKREQRSLTPSRPEGIVYPKRCPSCGLVEFKYISSTEFQCLNCSGILHKQPYYKPVDPLDSFLAPGESFMDFIPSNIPSKVDNKINIGVIASKPPPRIISPTDGEMGNNMRASRSKRLPRIIGPPDNRDDLECSYPTSFPDEEDDLPLLIPEPEKPKLEKCDDCGSGMRFIQLYEMWWCDKCQRYLGEEDEMVDESTKPPDHKKVDPEYVPEEILPSVEPFNERKADDGSIGVSTGCKIPRTLSSCEPRLVELCAIDNILEKYNKRTSSEDRDKLSLTEDIDNEFLIHRGREWLIEFMKMTNPIKTRCKWKDSNLQIEYRDDKDRLCVLMIDRSGDEIKPLFYRSSAYRKHGFGSDESDTF